MSEHPQADVRASRRTAVLFVTLLITAVFLGMVRQYLGALFLAALLATAARPLQRFNVRLLNGRDGWAAAITLVGLIVPALVVFWILGTVIKGQAADLFLTTKAWLLKLQDPQEGTQQIQMILDRLPFADRLELSPDKVKHAISEHAGPLISEGSAVLQDSIKLGVGWFSKAFGVVGILALKFFVMLYSTFFFLKEGPNIRRDIQQTIPLPKDIKERLVAKGVSVIRATLKGTLVIAVIQGVLTGGAFAVVGIKGSAFWGLVAAFASLIPAVGTALVWGPAVLYLCVITHFGAALGLLVWSVFVVGLVDNFLRPRLVGNDARMPDLLILVSTLGGCHMFGAIGVLVGPAVAALCVLMWDVFQQTFKETYNRDAEVSESIEAEQVVGVDGPQP
jgi:predicted PurR-regulated permease PerM